MTKTRNPFVTADSGVTNTIDAPRFPPRPCHTCESIPARSHRSCKSCRRATSGTTTTVTPSGEQYAGSMNDMLLPPARARHLHYRALPPDDRPQHLLL